MKRFGDPASLRFSVTWEGAASGDAEQRTEGSATLEVGSRYVWGNERSAFSWTWIELLEFLAEAWRFLLWEETYPDELDPRTPLLVEDSFEHRREYLGGRAAADLHDEVLSFLEHHDLARGLQGATAAPVRILRMGHRCTITTRSAHVDVPLTTVLAVLDEIGTEIAGRLQGATDPRSLVAMQAWDARATVTEDFLLEFGAKLPRSHWSRLTPHLPPDTRDWSSDELFAAARFAGASLSVDAFERLMNELATLGSTSTPELDELSALATSKMEPRQRAFEEGYELARSLRSRLGGTSSDRRIDVATTLRRLRVAIHDVDLDTPTLNAVAVFGPARGPSILVNTAGRHAKGVRGRRATLAHELCHLLVDRGGALPLAEALGGKSPRRPEQRANAFAAELLVPGEHAAKTVVQMEPEKREDCKELVRQLSMRFGASHSVCAWQVLNGSDVSGTPLQQPARGWLESIARFS